MVRIGRRNILINKNIDKVKEDFRNLQKSKVFLGDIDDNKFIFYSKNRTTINFRGELFPVNSNETIAKIKIIISLFELAISIIFYIFIFILFYKSSFNDNMLFKIIFHIILFLIPLLNTLPSVYKMFKMFDKYNKGYYINYKERFNIDSDYSNEGFVNKLKEKKGRD
jgi:hypothetical protein